LILPWQLFTIASPNYAPIATFDPILNPATAPAGPPTIPPTTAPITGPALATTLRTPYIAPFKLNNTLSFFKFNGLLTSPLLKLLNSVILWEIPGTFTS